MQPGGGIRVAGIAYEQKAANRPEKKDTSRSTDSERERERERKRDRAPLYAAVTGEGGGSHEAAFGSHVARSTSRKHLIRRHGRQTCERVPGCW